MRKKRVGAKRAAPYRAPMSPFDRIAESLTWLTSHDRAPALAALASRAGMSRFHFQRTFQRLVGVSPLRFQQVLRDRAACSTPRGTRA